MISIVIPIYNEQEGIADLKKGLQPVLDSLQQPYEIVLVNDGSTDQTRPMLELWAKEQPEVRCIHFSRNFGFYLALKAGLENANGDTVFFIDADLQEPPEILLKFLEYWQQGYQIIYAVRNNRQDPWLKNTLATIFYWTMQSNVEISLPKHASGCCLLDRKAADVILKIPEKSLFLPFLRRFVGFRQIGIPTPRKARLTGIPMSWTQSLHVAGIAFFANSIQLLQWIRYAGWCVLSCGMAVGGYVFWAYFNGSEVADWIIQLAVSLGFGGLELLGLGLLAQLLSHIYHEALKRPSYIIDRQLGE